MPTLDFSKQADPIAPPSRGALDFSSAAAPVALDDTADQQAAFRAQHGADVPLPSAISSNLPASTPSLGDVLVNQSIGAGNALSAGLLRSANVLPFVAAGLSSVLGDQANADRNFAVFDYGKKLADQSDADAQAASKPAAVAGSILALLPKLANPASLALDPAAHGTDLAASDLQQGGSLANAYTLGGVGTAAGAAQLALPVSAPGNVLVRALTGGGLNMATSAGEQGVEHAIAPKTVAAPTVESTLTAGGIGAILAAALGHGAPAPAGAEPTLEADPLPQGLPRGADFSAKAEPVRPATPDVGGPVHVDARGTAATPAQGATAFAQAVQQAASAPRATGLPEPVMPVDSAGTAMTTADQHAALQPTPADPLGLTDRLRAMIAADPRSAREGAPIEPPPPRALPAPTIAVDRAGQAMTPAQRMAAEQAAQDAAQQRTALGITPDIQRTQGVRWSKQADYAAAEAERQARIKELDDEIAAREKANAPKRGINAKPDESVDDALTFLAKQGGLDRRTFVKEGLDPAAARAPENLTRGGASRPLFRANGGGGLSLDDAARVLWQHGYLPEQDNNAALDLILHGVNQGEPSYSIHRNPQDDLLSLQQARQDADHHVTPTYDDVPFSFAGERARTADRKALDTAKQMEAMGRDSVPDRYGNQPGSPEDTHTATGWHRGVDDKWRFEIDDSTATVDHAPLQPSKARSDQLNGLLAERSHAFKAGDSERVTALGEQIKQVAAQRPKISTSTTVGDVLHHPALFDAYPELRKVKIGVDHQLKGGGAYLPGSNTIAVREPELYAASGDGSLKSVLLHEIQHAIQNHEGFARGGSSAEARKMPEFEQALRQQMAERGGELPAWDEVKPTDPELTKAAREVYRRLAGEVEARNTQRRLTMDAAQRREVPPSETADVPRHQQIVRFNADRANAEDSHAPQKALDSVSDAIAAQVGQHVRLTPAAAVPDSLARALDAWGRAFDVTPIVFTNHDAHTFDFQGINDRQGHVLINEDSPAPILGVSVHETLHQMETDAPDLHAELVEEIKRQGRLDAYGAVLRERSKASGADGEKLSDRVVRNELIADAAGDAMLDPAFVERLAQRNPALFRRVADYFMDALRRITSKLRSLGSSPFLDDVEAFRTKLADVLERYAERQQGGGERAPEERAAPSRELATREPDALSRKSDGDRGLVAVHNTTGEKVLHAIRMGGMAVPSIAVTRAEHALTNFGDITLLAHPDLVDPKQGAKAFGADIYSPRYPTVDHKLTPAVERAIEKKMQPFGGLGGSWAHNGNDTLDSLTRDKAFQRYVADKTGGEAVSVPHHVLKEEAQTLLREAGAQERLFKGYTANGRSYKPHTLENVVAILKKELRGGEGFNYGVGSLRAHFTPQFRSLAQMRAAGDRLTDKATFDKVKDEVDKEFFWLVDALRPHYQHGDANRFGFSDTVINALTDAAKLGVPRALREYGIDGVDQATQQKVAEYLTKLRSLPTEYFEVKQPRAVGVHEFHTAIVPHDTKPQVREALSQQGLHLVDYPRGDEAARQAAVHAYVHSDAGDALRFSRKGSEDAENPSILFSRKPSEQELHPEDMPSRRPGESQAAYLRRITRKNGDDIRAATALAKTNKVINRQLLRAKMAGEARSLAIADAALAHARKTFDKTPDVINLASVHQFETGQPIADPDFRAFAATMKDGFDQRVAEIHRLAPDALKSLIEHYMPHLYEDSGKAVKWYQSVMGKRPMDGDKSFLKQRTWPTLKEAMASGLKPVSPNPVDWVLMKYHQMDKFIGMLRYRDQLKERGWIMKQEPGQRPPEGWARVDNPAFQIAGGLQGHYVVPEGMARDINTLLAPGLEQYGAWRTFRAAQNALVSANLGFSAFHAAFTSTDNVVTHLGVGLNRLAIGDFAGGARHILEAIPTVITGPFHGGKLNKQWTGQAAMDPHVAALLDLLEQGGARSTNSPEMVSYNNALPSIARGLRRMQAPGYLPDRADDLRRMLAIDGPLAGTGKLVWGGAKGVGRAFSAVGELGSYAIHHLLVPNQKMAARVTLLKFELDRYAAQLGKKRGDYAGIVSVMNPDVARQLASEVNDRVDFRLGQMIYDNYFVPKMVRQLAQAVLMAPGWLAGGVQTALGGVRDIPRMVKPAKLVGPLDAAGTITDAHRGRVGNNLASLAALFLLVGGGNAIAQYLMSGEGPQELRDYVAPRTGRKNTDGTDERITSPNYLKDHYELVNHPIATLGHKLNPSLRMLWDIAHNQDYFGNMIRDPHHGAGQQAEELASYLLKGMLPLSAQNLSKARENGDGPGTIAAGFFGFNPAPASLTRSKFQAFVAKGGEQGWDYPSATPAEAAYQDRKRKAEDALRTGQTPDYTGLDPKDVFNLKKKVRTEKPELQFDRLSLADKLDAYAMATPAERTQYHLARTLLSNDPRRSIGFRRLPDEEQRALMDRIAAIRREAQR